VENRGNRLSLDISEGLTVLGDADGLAQVLINLISNANEHTEKGEIRVSVSRDRESVLVSVSDTGEGIMPEALPGIFGRRARRGGHEKRARQAKNFPLSGGGGIGLSICREIVERHGGTIGIESEPGKGTKVFFRLPAVDR
jgi:signal transduction histidine kinase